jgi:hypothetical protein
MVVIKKVVAIISAWSIFAPSFEHICVWMDRTRLYEKKKNQVFFFKHHAKSYIIVWGLTKSFGCVVAHSIFYASSSEEGKEKIIKVLTKFSTFQMSKRQRSFPDKNE